MFSELCSLITLPFEHFTASFIAITAPYAISLAYRYYKSLQACKQMIGSLPEMDTILTGQTQVDESQKQLVQMVQTLKEKMPAARNLTRIAFCDNDSGTYANNIQVIKIDSQYALLVGENLSNCLTDAEKKAILAHELTHIQNDDACTVDQSIKILTKANEALFMSATMATTCLGVKSIFSWSENLPVMTQILMISALIAKAHSMYNKHMEFRADQGVLALAQDPKALIMAIKKKDALDKEWIIKHHGKKNSISVETFLPTYPAVNDREKALGVAQAPPASPC